MKCDDYFEELDTSFEFEFCLELELGLEQGRGRRLHNRSSGCKGSGASGSGITDTSRFFAYS